MSNPPRPLTEEDIWFQIGHVHEQQKDVSICLTECLVLGLTDCSSKPPKGLTKEFSNAIHITQRCYSSLAGFITKKADTTKARSKPLSTLRSL